MNQLYYTKSASIIHRQTNRFYDRALASFHVGCGQQFFLAKIYEHNGISMYDLAKTGHFDKGTVTKAVQKLEELGYIQSCADADDRRIRRLYTTPAAEPVIETLRQSKQRWDRVLTESLSPEEAAELLRLMTKMAENAYHYIEKGVSESNANP